MGDEIDGLDLPEHLVSGNMDRGQVSEINRQEEGEQAIALESVLTNYYSGNSNFNTVLRDLTDLGYTEERAEQIRQSAHEERIIRTQTGEASGLTPNQLSFIETNRLAGQSIQISHNFQVLLDGDNRQYILDRRVREDDGTPSRLYLPAPEQFEALTIAQQEIQQQRLEEARPDFLQNFVLFDYPTYTGDRLRTEFSRRDLGLIDRYSSLYLADPTQENLNSLRDNIDLLTDAQYTQNSNDILNQYFIDLQFEANHRANNNGRPQLLTEEQYNILRGDTSYNWDGGNIYQDDDTGNLYYYNTRTERRTAIPDLETNEQGEEVITQGIMPNQIDLPTSITTITLQESYDPSTSVRFSRQALTQLEQDRLRLEMANTINGQQSYKDFLSRINTEYSLSNRQFIDVSDYVLRNTGEQVSYSDATATTAYIDVPAYYVTSGGRTTFTTDPEQFRTAFSDIDRGLVDNQIINFNDNFDVIHYAVQTSARIVPTINPEQNVLEQLQQGQLDPSLLRPPDVSDLERPHPFIRPITRDPLVPTILQDLAEGIPIPPEDIAPPEVRPIFEGTTGDPPIVPGTTLLSGGDVVPPQESVARYERYFDSRQNQFTPFRNMFRDILPIFTGATGGYFAFSYARSRERGTLLTIIREERIFIENLEVRLENINNLLDRARGQQRSALENFIIGEEDLSKIETQQRSEIISARQQYARRGEGREAVVLASQELRRSRNLVRDMDTIRLQKKRETQDLLLELRQAENNLDSLEMDIVNEEITRTEASARIERSLQADREILQDINRYNPEILAGFSIGQTLGLALSGYFFPEYVDIEEDQTFMKADNVNYNSDKHKQNLKAKKEGKKQPAQPNPDITSGSIIAGEGTASRKAPEIVRSFIPTKSNSNGTPLTYKQIQDYKSTLSSDELKKLQGKMLIFGANEKVIKKDSICRSVQKQTLIRKIPIKI